MTVGCIRLFVATSKATSSSQRTAAIDKCHRYRNVAIIRAFFSVELTAESRGREGPVYPGGLADVLSVLTESSCDDCLLGASHHLGLAGVLAVTESSRDDCLLGASHHLGPLSGVLAVSETRRDDEKYEYKEADKDVGIDTEDGAREDADVSRAATDGRGRGRLFVSLVIVPRGVELLPVPRSVLLLPHHMSGVWVRPVLSLPVRLVGCFVDFPFGALVSEGHALG